MEVVLALLAVFVISLLLWLAKNRPVTNLPGPMGLPIVGYLPFMTKKPHIKLIELRHKYGPIYRITLGSQNVVVLCDYNLIKDAFARDDYMGLPPNMPFHFSQETMRTGAITGTPWKEQKRFSLQMLRDLGLGKTQMENHLKEEVEELIQRIRETSEIPVRMSDLLAPSMSNNIASFMFGKRLKYNDPRRRKLDEILASLGVLNIVIQSQMFFPWMKPIIQFFDGGKAKKLSQVKSEVTKYIMEEMEEHEKTFDSNNVRDYLDGYILEIEKRSNGKDSTFKREILGDVARGFFVAGSDSVRIAIDWLLLLCAAYPEVQKKIHHEVDTVLGANGFPSYQDRVNMPYTEACICESLRWRTPIPLNFLRYTLKDTELNGYFIPKHTRILAVPYSIDHDETLWGNDVDVFKPERFLSRDGKKSDETRIFHSFFHRKKVLPRPIASPGRSICIPYCDFTEIRIFLATW